MNRLFNTYSAKIRIDITPHVLRHFFCSNAIEKGMSIHEVANQAGKMVGVSYLINEFSVKFMIIEKQQEHLIKYNQFQLQLKENPLPPEHPFITKNIQTYFQK